MAQRASVRCSNGTMTATRMARARPLIKPNFQTSFFIATLLFAGLFGAPRRVSSPCTIGGAPRVILSDDFRGNRGIHAKGGCLWERAQFPAALDSLDAAAGAELVKGAA